MGWNGGSSAWHLCFCLCWQFHLSGCQSNTTSATSAPAASSPSSRPQQSGDQDIGPCVCDLTRASCDVNCCCDPDCVALGLIAGFDCLAAGPVNRSAHSCHSKGWLHNVNPRVDFWVVADDLQGLLCVAVDNNVIKGVFHKNELLESPSRIDSARAEQRLESYGQMLAENGPSAQRHPATESRGYQAGDILKVHRVFSQTTGAILPAQLLGQTSLEAVSNMPFSSPDMLGVCASGRNTVRFLVDVPTTSCWLGPVQLDSACESVLNHRSANAWMVRKMHLPETGRCGNDRCVQPQVNYSCPWKITSFSGAVSESPCVAASEESSLGRAARFTRSGSACSCSGALREIKYTIIYGYDAKQEGVVIKSVKTHITLQDIRSDKCQPVRVPQYMSVRFLQDGSSLSEVHRQRSGHPGYQIGFPMLAATCKRYDVSDNCDAFETSPTLSPFATVHGILPDGTCSLKVKSEAGQGNEIKFGEDAVFGCTVPYTRQNLSTICRAGSPTGFMDVLQLLPFGRLGGRWTHLAAFGDLRGVEPMARAGELVEVTALQGSKALEFDESQASKSSTSTCRDAVVGVNLEILYSPFGEVRNPQARIVAARQSHVRGNLHFTQPDPTQPQLFQFYFAVSFVRVDDTGKQQSDQPPRPQLPLWLPYDLFYPFGLSRSNAMQTHGVQAPLVIVIAALALLVL